MIDINNFTVRIVHYLFTSNIFFSHLLSAAIETQNW
jgi:hypothetical protein